MRLNLKKESFRKYILRKKQDRDEIFYIFFDLVRNATCVCISQFR